MWVLARTCGRQSTRLEGAERARTRRGAAGRRGGENPKRGAEPSPGSYRTQIPNQQAPSGGAFDAARACTDQSSSRGVTNNLLVDKKPNKANKEDGLGGSCAVVRGLGRRRAGSWITATVLPLLCPAGAPGPAGHVRPRSHPPSSRNEAPI